ncbi:ATP-binding protein, partial [Mammaliicoccus sciuri]
MAQLSITETIIYGLFQTSLFVVLLALTQNYRYSKRDYVILLLGYMIPSLALYFIVGVASIIFVITFLGVFFYFKFRIFGIINTLLVIIISVVSDYLSSLLIRLIFN